MSWTEVEAFLSDLTAVSLLVAPLLYLLALRWPLRTLAHTAMGIAWGTSGVLLVGHLAATGRLNVWWLGIWWLILWFASFEIPLATRVLGIPTALLGLLFLFLPRQSLPFGWDLLNQAGLVLGGSLLLLGCSLSLLFRWKAVQRRIPWFPDLIEGLQLRLATGALCGLLLALLGELGAFFARPPHGGVVLGLILAIGLLLTALYRRGSSILLFLATLCAILAGVAAGMIHF